MTGYFPASRQNNRQRNQNKFLEIETSAIPKKLTLNFRKNLRLSASGKLHLLNEVWLMDTQCPLLVSSNLKIAWENQTIFPLRLPSSGGLKFKGRSSYIGKINSEKSNKNGFWSDRFLEYFPTCSKQVHNRKLGNCVLWKGDEW